MHFREGPRAPLVTPPHCGTYTTEAELTPWAGPGDPVDSLRRPSRSPRASGGGPCPAGGVPPFRPGFDAGSINNNAGAYSPFYMRLTRCDGEQDMTRFYSVLPQGVTGKLAGVAKCPDAAIAAAEGQDAAAQELASPSCPAGSRDRPRPGRRGRRRGAHLRARQDLPRRPLRRGSALASSSITPAVAGPFDVGTVVVREALTAEPGHREVEVDGASSDPIPHICGDPAEAARPARLRRPPQLHAQPDQLRAKAVKATLFGGFLDVFSPADDVPVALSHPLPGGQLRLPRFKPRSR